MKKKLCSSKIRLLPKIEKNLIRKTFTLVLMFFMISGVYASDKTDHVFQKRIITGIVTEAENGEDMPGVSVFVKNTTKGTMTDAYGKYSIEVESDATVLVFNFIGKKAVEVTVGKQTSINVKMENDATMLDEVVYTGYMTQKKADLTGSLAMAGAADIEKNPSANAMKSLQGKLAGVHITTNGGDPSEDVTIQIRGLSSLSGAVKPLIVLDGMPTESLNLRDINTGDIESIQVLKDAASASIYGARASGGVILVQTKKGQVGKTKVEYSGSVSFANAVNKPKLMNAEQYGRAIFQAKAYDEFVYGNTMELPAYFNYDWHRDTNGLPVLDGISPAEWIDAKTQALRVSDTNWLDEIYRTAIMTNHQLTVSSGTDKSTSLFSLGYFDNEGTQIHTFFRKYSVRANSEYKLINNRLKIGENLAVSYLKYRGGNQTFQASLNPPVLPVHDVNGNWAGDLKIGDYLNPARILTMNKDNVNNFVKVIGNVYADLAIWKGISARTQFGIDYGNGYERTVEGMWSETGGRNSNGENFVRSNQSHRFNSVWTNTLSYNMNLGKHSIDAVFGTEATRFVAEGFSARNEGLYSEDRDFAHIGVTIGNKKELRSSADEYTYFSIFGKANYAFNSRYLFSVTMRRDGSSLFGQNNRYGTFPAFSGGWRLNEEEFMKGYTFISDLKLRASWGTNGSVQGLPRGYTTTPYVTDYDRTSYPIEGNGSGSLWSGYRRTWLGNPNLKWETTKQTDLAVDFGFLNQRINGSLGYYHKATSDILVSVPHIAAMGEGEDQWINGANMNNSGFEFAISYSNDPKNVFQYTITANVGTYKTKIIDLPKDAINKYPGDGVYDLVVGRTPNILYGLVADGIFKTQEEVDAHGEQPGKAVGRIRYKDLDGNGKVDDYDRTYIGITDPDFFGGLTFDFKYRDFDMNIFFQGVYGNKVYNYWKENSDLWFIVNPSGRNHDDRILGAWYFDNQNSDIPAMTNITTNNELRHSSYYVEDGSYLKLRNIELGYTLPKKISNRISMQNLRVYVSARNVLTFKKGWGKDKYTSFDPESPNPGIGDASGRYGYLTPFSMTFGLNVTF